MNVTGHDPDLALLGRDQSGAVWSDEGDACFLNGLVNADHVQHGNAFGNRGDDFDSRIDCFQDRIGSERRRHKDHRGVSAHFLDGLVAGVENGQVANGLSAFAGRHTADHVRAVLETTVRVELTDAAGDTLADYFRVFIYKNSHLILFLC